MFLKNRKCYQPKYSSLFLHQTRALQCLQNKSGWHGTLEDEYLANNAIDLRQAVCMSLLCDCSHSVPSTLKPPGDASEQTLRLNAVITIYYLPQRLPIFFKRNGEVLVSMHHCKYTACSSQSYSSCPRCILAWAFPLPNLLFNRGWKWASSADRCVTQWPIYVPTF